MLYTITTGRLLARPPMLREGSATVEVLDAENQRLRVRVADLVPGQILLGLGVIARIERAAEAA